MRQLTTIADTLNDYDGYILDLWGVVHDGEKLYAGVRETFALLREHNKQIVILSNAPRRSQRAAEVLVRLGVDEGKYDHLITSGEVMYDVLSRTKGLGHHYYFIGPDKDLDVLSGLDYARSGLLQADFILNVGFFYDGQEMSELESSLLTAARLRKPMICANPDLVVVRQSGERLGCAGLIAQSYEGMGGSVTYYGKPHRSVYDACLSRFENVSPKRILAVGDSLHTDIFGANQAGIDACLVLGGILAETLYAAHGTSADMAVLARLCEEQHATPTMTVPRFGI
jgi:HAD superfamily hydrolase (TIGR01459 family)